MNSWCTDSLYSYFFSSIWWMQQIWSVVDLLRLNPHWWCPIISSMYGLDLIHRIQVRGFLNIFMTSLFLRWGVVKPTPNPQSGGQPIVGCLRLFIPYIRSFPPHLEGVSSIRNLRTFHAVATREALNMDTFRLISSLQPSNCLHLTTYTQSCFSYIVCLEVLILFISSN
jgi:hypothetical protein